MTGFIPGLERPASIIYLNLGYSRVKVALAATMWPVKAYRGVRRTGCEEADEVRLARLEGKFGRNFLLKTSGKNERYGNSYEICDLSDFEENK